MKEVTVHNTLRGEVSLEGGKRATMKLTGAPRIVACMPIGAKDMTRRFETPDGNQWLASSVATPAMIPAAFMTAHMQMVPPLGMGIHYLFRWGMLSGEARQILTMSALERVQEDGYIWYLDDDVIMPPYGLFTLYNFMEQHPEVGLVSGVYSSRTTPTEPFIYKEHLKGAHWNLTVGPAAQPEPIFGCGAGFMLARVKAIRDIMKLYPDKPIWADSKAVYDDGGSENWGHDIRFCRLMHEAGWGVYVDGRVECGHFDAASGIVYYLPDSSPPKVRGRGTPVQDVQKIALVLATHGHLDYAARCAASFRKHTVYPTTIIAVDSGTPGITNDQFAEWAKENGIEHAFRFEDNEGSLTRSWNYGLALSKANGYQYTVCGTTDTLYSPGWDLGIRSALEHADLAGAVTNAPGFGSPTGDQNIDKYLPDYLLTDDEASIASVAERIRGIDTKVLDNRPEMSAADGFPATVLPEIINGYTMVAKTRTWWSGSFDKNFVFNPGLILEGNEIELQMRWALLGRKAAIVPSSFIFHYRSLSRGEKYFSKGAFRPCVEQPS